MVDEQIRARGIRSERVLSALRAIPRENFIPEGLEAQAYEDRALSIGLGQTISQPYMVAVMTEALGLSPDDRVLEIGSGSGYQTAVLAFLATEVFTVERVPSLGQRAMQKVREAGFENVESRIGDGTLGWPEKSPFDAILVTAGAPRVPPSLKAQLKEEGGRIVAPVGDRFIQDLIRMTRTGDEFESESLLSCRFVPLVGEEGWPPT